MEAEQEYLQASHLTQGYSHNELAEMGWLKLSADNLIELSICRFQLTKYVEAFEAVEEALKIYGFLQDLSSQKTTRSDRRNGSDPLESSDLSRCLVSPERGSPLSQIAFTALVNRDALDFAIATADLQMAKILSRINAPQIKEKHLSRSIELITPMVATHGKRPQYMTTLMNAHIQMAEHQMYQQNLNEARAHAQIAVELNKPPLNQTLVGQATIVSSWTTRGRVEMMTGDVEQALTHYQQANQFAQQSFESQPGFVAGQVAWVNAINQMLYTLNLSNLGDDSVKERGNEPEILILVERFNDRMQQLMRQPLNREIEFWLLDRHFDNCRLKVAALLRSDDFAGAIKTAERMLLMGGHEPRFPSRVPPYLGAAETMAMIHARLVNELESTDSGGSSNVMTDDSTDINDLELKKREQLELWKRSLVKPIIARLKRAAEHGQIDDWQEFSNDPQWNTLRDNPEFLSWLTKTAWRKSNDQ